MTQTKILLVEDDAILAKVLYGKLSEAGFEENQAFDGEVGLAMAKSGKWDLILLDLILPKKDGFEVLDELKNDLSARSMPVIILTMLGADEDIKKGLQLGADDYIIKAQHAIREIVEKIKKFLEKAPR